MDWTQVITLGSYLTALCGFIYYFNQNTIKEWREEHSKQLKEWREEHSKQLKEWREEHTKQIENSDKHWREMFMHFNCRLDEMKKGN